jgi:hypothetical protein
MSTLRDDVKGITSTVSRLNVNWITSTVSRQVAPFAAALVLALHKRNKDALDLAHCITHCITLCITLCITHP